MVKWSFSKGKTNERGPYMLVEWLCANKRNKSIRITILGCIVVHNRKNKRRGPYILVVWPCAKERINERGPYIFAKWSCENKTK